MIIILYYSDFKISNNSISFIIDTDKQNLFKNIFLKKNDNLVTQFYYRL